MRKQFAASLHQSHACKLPELIDRLPNGIRGWVPESEASPGSCFPVLPTPESALAQPEHKPAFAGDSLVQQPGDSHPESEGRLSLRLVLARDRSRKLFADWRP